MSWLLFLAGAKRVGSAVWGIISHASLWQLVSAALLIFAVIQHFELAHVRKDAAAYAKQRDDYKAQLDAISSKRNEQKKTTEGNIKIVTRTIHDADGRAKEIEQAPLPGNCKSSPEVLNADI